jgi:GNAT superfamily N-acetyltransferase
MHASGAEQVEAAVAHSVAALGAVTDRDWAGVRAGRLEWTCRETAEHVAGDLIGYATQLAGREQDAYAPFDIALLDDADNAGTLRVVSAMGVLLAAAVRTTPRSVRAFHPFPFRHASREGFAAMGIAEVLLHTHDIAEGLGIAYEPPADLCEFVLTRIFPHVRPGPSVTTWRWYNNPVLRSERLGLEGVTPAVAASLSVAGDGGFTWAGGAPAEGTRVGAGIGVKQYEEGTFLPEWGMYVLVRREDDRAVGAMGFHGAPADGRVEIGYDLVVEARGNGYATEALRTLSAWALEQDAVHTVVAVVEEPNVPSQKVVTRAGFTEVSRQEGRITYELRA